MPPIVRSVLAIFLGMLACFFLIRAGQLLSVQVFPPPPGLDFSKPETAEASIRAAIEAAPTGAFVLSLVSWAVATFIGAGIASRIAPVAKIGHGMAIGVLFLLMSLGQMNMFPHPTWFKVIGVAEFLPIAFLGAKLSSLNPSGVDSKQ